jgi:hypothetical protein
MSPKSKQWADFLQSIALVWLLAYQAAIATGQPPKAAVITASLAALGASKGHLSANPLESPVIAAVVVRPTTPTV